MIDMKDFRSWAQGSRCHEQLKAVDDMCHSGLKLRSISVMNSSGLWLAWMNLGRKLWALDAMNNTRLSMTLPTLGREPALDAINSFGLWLRWTTSSCELWALDAMSSRGLSITWKSSGHELRTQDSMNNSRFIDDMKDFESWAQGFRFYEQLRVVDDTNDSRLWA